jgi:hypothetical protein
MIRECFKTATGILFNADGLRSIGLNPSALFPIVLPRPGPKEAKGMKIRAIPKDRPTSITADRGQQEAMLEHYAYPDGTGDAMDINGKQIRCLERTEEEEELHDAMSPVYDQLSLAPHWWALELVPMLHKYHEVRIQNHSRSVVMA